MNPKILIVEDDPSFLWILRKGLEDQEFSVFSAQDGEEGFEIAKKEKPDLILLDIMLPKMDGMTMAKKLKEENIFSRIIFLTNLSDTNHISEAVELSKETDYVVKSDFHIDQIVAMIKKRLGI
jgi:two-component system alkaline phosphatase synthesis response regulator PhoP